VAAKVVVVFHVLAYGLLQFVFEVNISFIHVYAILFVIEVAMMWFIGQLYPIPVAWHYHREAVVDMTPWRYAKPTAILLVACIVATYFLFSPMGIAQ
jgi:SSS family solute:Na+ symporter